MYRRRYRPLLKRIDPYVQTSQKIYIFGALWLLGIVLFVGLEIKLTNMPNWTDSDVFALAQLFGLVFGGIALVLGAIRHATVSVLGILFGLGALGAGQFGDLTIKFSQSKAVELNQLVETMVKAQFISGGLIIATLLTSIPLVTLMVWNFLSRLVFRRRKR